MCQFQSQSFDFAFFESVGALVWTRDTAPVCVCVCVFVCLCVCVFVCV